jgi:hypothetical protein
MIVPVPPASAVAFVDAQHGWYATSKGLFGTSDGRTFHLQVRMPIIGISALDRTQAWALTARASSCARRTATTGEHWVRRTSFACSSSTAASASE